MIRLALTIAIISIIYLIFNGGLEVKVNGEKYTLEVEQSREK